MLVNCPMLVVGITIFPEGDMDTEEAKKNCNYSALTSSRKINFGQVSLNKQSNASPAPTPCLRQVDR